MWVEGKASEPVEEETQIRGQTLGYLCMSIVPSVLCTASHDYFLEFRRILCKVLISSLYGFI